MSENAAVPFVLEVEAGADNWNFIVNGVPQLELSYVRTDKFRELPLILQMYDMLNPRVTIKNL